MVIWVKSRKFRVSGNGKSYKMRLPTCAEWDKLADIAREDDAIMHWKDIFSWCPNVGLCWMLNCEVRGYHSARRWRYYYATLRDASVGFRPAFEALDSGAALPDGAVITIGTLYMGGRPVRIPQKPTWYGDITQYVPGAKLELREALDDPAYQVRAIKVGNILIADRVLFKNISWNDIREAL